MKNVLQSLALGSVFALTIALVPAMAARTDVTIGMVLEPPNLDPTAGAAAAIDEIVYLNVFEGLTKMDGNGAILPGLAESWDISEDGLTYTFHLHSGVKFHDGSDFDAEDVKFSLDRARAEDSTNAQKALFADIASVDVVDPMTVKVTLSKPNGNLLFNLSWGDAVMVAPESAANNATQPIGTGPYEFKEWVQGDHVELAKTGFYWGEPVKIDKAVFKFIADPTAAFAAVMAGDVDGFSNFPAPENMAQFEADPRFKVVVGSTEGETILAMNNKMPPFDNVKVREAVSHAINRQEIIDGAMYGFGTPIGTHFAPHNPDYVDLTAQSDYNVDKAKALLAEAGYADGFTTTLKLPPPSYARRGGEIIAAQLRAIGINAEITNVEWAQWLEDVFKAKNYGLTIVSHVEPMDIGIYARPEYYFQYDNADFQQIMTDLNNATDPAMRSDLLKKAQHKIADDYVNAYLFELAKVAVWDAKLEGMWVNAPTPANDLSTMYWAD